MPAINLVNISFSYAVVPVLNDVSLYVSDGERACLVGPNGCGKTTLLRIAAGDLPAQWSKIEGTESERFQVPSIEQFPGNVVDYLDAALSPLRTIAGQFVEVTSRIGEGDALGEWEREYDQLLAQITSFDIWSLDVRVAEVLAGLGLISFIRSGRNQELSRLSPDQRGRLQLAATLILKPAALILDEPTNHLDAQALGFLAQTVNSWGGPVLMASHSRAFIKDTVTVIYDMDVEVFNALAKTEGVGEITGLYRCMGAYSGYLAEKTRARTKYMELHAAQQAETRKVRRHRQAAGRISRGGVRLASAEGKAKKFFANRVATTATRRIRNGDQRLDTLAAREIREPCNYELSFALAQPAERTDVAVSARQASAEQRLAPISFDVVHGEHLLTTGANGLGKSTLLNWISSGQPPADASASGTVTRDKAVSLVPQHLPKVRDFGFTTEVWRRGIGKAGKGILHSAMWATSAAHK